MFITSLNNIRHRCNLLTISRYDLEKTFTVIVGDPPSESKRFTLHTSVFVAQSEFFAAACKPAWTAQNPGKPVDLKDEDPELFHAYMNCVYFGHETIRHWIDTLKLPPKPEVSTNGEQQAQDAIFTTIISLQLLCQKLIDFKAANIVIDEMIRFSSTVKTIPSQGPIALAYGSALKDNPLRSLLRDYWIYESGNANRQVLCAEDFPAECLGRLPSICSTSSIRFLFTEAIPTCQSRIFAWKSCVVTIYTTRSIRYAL